MKIPNFEIAHETDHRILLCDVGPWDVFPTITNAPEAVIEWLFYNGHLPSGRRVWYRDSDGVLSELLHDGRNFTGYFTPLDERNER